MITIAIILNALFQLEHAAVICPQFLNVVPLQAIAVPNDSTCCSNENNRPTSPNQKMIQVENGVNGQKFDSVYAEPQINRMIVQNNLQVWQYSGNQKNTIASSSNNIYNFTLPNTSGNYINTNNGAGVGISNGPVAVSSVPTMNPNIMIQQTSTPRGSESGSEQNPFPPNFSNETPSTILQSGPLFDENQLISSQATPATISSTIDFRSTTHPININNNNFDTNRLVSQNSESIQPTTQMGNPQFVNKDTTVGNNPFGNELSSNSNKPNFQLTTPLTSIDQFDPGHTTGYLNNNDQSTQRMDTSNDFSRSEYPNSFSTNGFEPYYYDSQISSAQPNEATAVPNSPEKLSATNPVSQTYDFYTSTANYPPFPLSTDSTTQIFSDNDQRLPSHILYDDQRMLNTQFGNYLRDSQNSLHVFGTILFTLVFHFR